MNNVDRCNLVANCMRLLQCTGNSASRLSHENCCRLRFHTAHRPRTLPSAVEAQIRNVPCTLIVTQYEQFFYVSPSQHDIQP
ncbi:uncharacterized protein ARMOST_02179 [Armillaria ostoyae]|uniref:Uncharacterized protein n=1 Tax=Armillaria ostoyae TaxID=47428 RepID=A0A284QR41_ARMOS|nr:uncharacterized protein ARMOST_02179 [Armillaria ostoyae]